MMNGLSEMPMRTALDEIERAVGCQCANELAAIESAVTESLVPPKFAPGKTVILMANSAAGEPLQITLPAQTAYKLLTGRRAALCGLLEALER